MKGHLNERKFRMDSHKENGLEKKLLYHLGSLPKLMLNHHMREDLIVFILHELCSENGFGLGKAAYFINNPDFKCLKGIAGHHSIEAYKGLSSQDHESFSKHMSQAQFHNQVRSHQDNHILNISDKTSFNALQDRFEFEQLGSHVWNLKHNNQAIFLFEKQNYDKIVDDHLFDFVQYLGFCPVY
jgi:hypothetical protein